MSVLFSLSDGEHLAGSVVEHLADPAGLLATARFARVRRGRREDGDDERRLERLETLVLEERHVGEWIMWAGGNKLESVGVPLREFERSEGAALASISPEGAKVSAPWSGTRASGISPQGSCCFRENANGRSDRPNMARRKAAILGRFDSRAWHDLGSPGSTMNALQRQPAGLPRRTSRVGPASHVVVSAVSAVAAALALLGCTVSVGGAGGQGGSGTTTSDGVSTGSSIGTGEGICGIPNYPCCGTTCNGEGVGCVSGQCVQQLGFGAACVDGWQCISNLCLASGHCSATCTSASDCPPADEWSCAPLSGFPTDMCQCTPSGADTCDGHDNDCDGTVDGGATCSEPGFTCQAGACACAPTNVCDGVCKDLAADVDNCGACGAACDAGDACVEGHCLTTLASGQNGGFGPVRGADALYWLNGGDGTVVRLALGGGAPVVLASGQVHPTHLAVDATHVYWTTGGDLGDGGGTVMKVPIAGGAPITLANATLPWAVAVDASNVYFSAVTPDAIQKTPLAGGAPVVLATSNGSPHAIAVDSSGVYWTQPGSVRRVALAGGPPEVLLDLNLNQTDGIALDATTIYFTTQDEVLKMPKSGGAPTSIASSTFPRGIAIDASRVYWADQDEGRILAVAHDGGPITVIASGQYAPFNVAVDATSVYWDTFDGNIMRAAK